MKGDTLRLILHIGATKTASTSLQLSMSLNEDVLAKHGVYVPRTGRTRRTTANHHNLAWQFLRDGRFRPEKGTWEDMLAEVREADPAVALVSSEAFARLAAGKRRASLARALRDTGVPVEMVYVVREPLARINSMYSQAVKTFGPADKFAEYSEQALATSYYNLDRAYRFWYGDKRPGVRESITFKAIRFDKFIERSPLECLLDVLETPIPTDELAMLEWESNVSPGPLAVAAFRLLRNQLMTLDSTFNRRSSAAADVSKSAQRAAVDLGWYEDRFWGWDPELAQQAANRLARSNERFAKAVWGESWPFPPPVDRECTALDLAQVRQKQRKSVTAFVDKMSSMYFKQLRRANKDRPRRRDDDEDVPPDESDDLAP